MLTSLLPFLRFALLALAAFWAIVGASLAGSFLGDTTRHVLGYAGFGLILAAQLYFLRKRSTALARLGTVKQWFGRHQIFTMIGALMVVVHSGGGGRMPKGIALVAVVLMLVTVISGMVGAYIHAQAVRARSQLRAELKQKGLSAAEVEDELVMLSFSEAAFRDWRKIHKPITMGFFLATAVHIAAMILFGGPLDRG